MTLFMLFALLVPMTSQPQPPGRLIDLDGYKLHLWCTGKGGPTVVLSAGSGDFSFDWALVQPGVAKVTRVCSYDRAGEAWSDLGPTPRTQAQEAFDLRRALRKVHIRGPYVLVGHSAGGTLARLFAADYPAEVVGIVLVDGSHEEDTGNINGRMVTGYSLSKGRPIPPPRTSVTAADGLDGDAIKKIQAMVAKYDFMQPKIEPPYDRLPADMQDWRLWAMGQPKHWAATSNDYSGEEAQRLYEIDHETARPLGSIPLIVLSQDMSERTDEHARIHIRTQQEQAQYSERGQQIVVTGAGHHIQLERPEVVIDAIKQVLAAAATDLAGNRFPCLPDSMKLSRAVGCDSTAQPAREMTLEETLVKMGARCKKGKLFDSKGKEIRFYSVQGFGAPTTYAIETMRRQRTEIEALKRQYTVIEIPSRDQPCEPIP